MTRTKNEPEQANAWYHSFEVPQRIIGRYSIWSFLSRRLSNTFFLDCQSFAVSGCANRFWQAFGTGSHTVRFGEASELKATPGQIPKTAGPSSSIQRARRAEQNGIMASFGAGALSAGRALFALNSEVPSAVASFRDSTDLGLGLGPETRNWVRSGKRSRDPILQAVSLEKPPESASFGESELSRGQRSATHHASQ